MTSFVSTMCHLKKWCLDKQLFITDFTDLKYQIVEQVAEDTISQEGARICYNLGSAFIEFFWIALVLSWTKRKSTAALLTHQIEHTSTLSSRWQSDSLQNCVEDEISRLNLVKYISVWKFFFSLSPKFVKPLIYFHCVPAPCALSSLPAAGVYLLCQCMTFKPAHYYHNSKFQHFSNSIWHIWSRQIHCWC